MRPVLLLHLLLGIVMTAKMTEWTTLRVTSIIQEPFLTLEKDGFSGYCNDLALEIGRLVRVNISINLVEDGKYGSFDPATGWDGMIGELIRGEADVAIAALTPTAQRERFVFFSKPFMNAPLAFVHKYAETPPGTTPDVSGNADIKQSSEDEDNTGQRVQMATSTTSSSQKKLTSFEDLSNALSAGQRYNILFAAGSSTEARFAQSNNDIYSRIYMAYSQSQRRVNSTSDGINEVRSDPSNVFIGEAPMLKYISSQPPCDLLMSKCQKISLQPVSSVYSVALPMQSPYQTVISQAINVMRESGYLEQLEHKWFESNQCVS